MSPSLPTQFTVTEDHLKLLRAMYVDWCDDEYGAPTMDPKRPYGNSDAAVDIAEILGEEVPEDDDDQIAWFDENRFRLYGLHRETQVALQIVLSTGTFAAGSYTRTMPYIREWTRAAEEENHA